MAIVVGMEGTQDPGSFGVDGGKQGHFHHNSLLLCFPQKILQSAKIFRVKAFQIILTVLLHPGSQKPSWFRGQGILLNAEDVLDGFKIGPCKYAGVIKSLFPQGFQVGLVVKIEVQNSPVVFRRADQQDRFSLVFQVPGIIPAKLHNH